MDKWHKAASRFRTRRPLRGAGPAWLLEIGFAALVRLAGYLLIAAVLLIFYFLFSQARPLFGHTALWDFITGPRWLPVSEPPLFGILPFIVGSAWIVSWALALGVPLGLAVAVYLAEMAGPRVRSLAGPLLTTLAGIPSVVYGVIGLLVVAPWVARLLSLPTGLTGLTAGTVLALMIVPTVATLSEEAIRSVPEEYREAALAMGATPFQARWTVLIPAASSGIAASVLLAMGRALGETMTVLMVGGGRLVLPTGLAVPMRTMTATLAVESAYAVHRSLHYAALFAMGLVLFAITFFITLAADRLMQRAKRGVGQT